MKSALVILFTVAVARADYSYMFADRSGRIPAAAVEGVTAEYTAGHWTGWCNEDSPRGTGEFEVWSRIFRKVDPCDLQCLPENAVIVQIRLKDQDASYHIEDALSCHNDGSDNQLYTVNPEIGFRCQESSLNNMPANAICEEDACLKMKLDANCQKCPDVNVRFFCSSRSCVSKQVEARDFLEEEDFRARALDDGEEEKKSRVESLFRRFLGPKDVKTKRYGVYGHPVYLRGGVGSKDVKTRGYNGYYGGY